MHDEQQIRHLIEAWAEATRTGRREEVLANHADNVLIFDVLPPLQYEGAAAYRRSWEEWQPGDVQGGLFDLRDLQVTAGQDVGFAHGIIHCGGMRPDGTTFANQARATFCLRKSDQRWLITHQHISMPVGGGEDEG